MANEFVARNGIIAKADSSITGTLAVSGNISSGGNTVATQTWVTTTALSGYATETYVANTLSDLIGAAPGTLDTLNELAAALGNDPNFATTVTNSIATKLPLAGGSMTGDITWTSTEKGLVWTMNTDGAYIKFFNTGDGDTNSRLEYATSDNGNEYHRFMVSGVERMAITATGISATGYNKSNWDTAYGWGNHGSAGYVTLATANTLYQPIGNYAAASHTHSAADITSGTLSADRLSGTYAINISGTAAGAVNADTVDGYHASQLTKIPLWTIDTQSEAKSGFVNGGNWYRIANLGTERFFTRVRIYDDSSGGPHASVEFQVAGAFNNSGSYSFTLTSNGYYSAPSVTQVRILSQSTYDPQYLEVYISYVGYAASTFVVSLLEARNATVVNWEEGDVPAGYTATTWDANGPFATGGRSAIFNSGVYNTNDYSRFGNVLVGQGTYKNTIKPIDDANLNIHTPSGAVYFDTFGQASGSFRAPIFYDSQDTNYYIDPNSTSVLNRVYTTGRLELTYNENRYQMNFNRSSGSNWWVTNDSDNLGLHLDSVGDKFYFGTGGDFWSATNGWLSTALAAKQNASTAITTSNIGSQSVNYATSSGNSVSTDQTNFSELFIENAPVATKEYVTSQGYITGYTETDPIYVSERNSLQLNKTVHPTLLFSTLADYNKPSGYSTMIQPSSYQNPLPSHGYYHIIARRDTGGGYGALLQSYNSHELYHGNTTESTTNISWYKIWNSGDFSSTNVSNWNTAYGWGSHASAGYATTGYVDNAVAAIVDTAPDTLNTLQELAAALGDDPNFATTVANNIAGKVSKSGDTITGTILSTNNANVDGANFTVDTTNKTVNEYAYKVSRSGSAVGGVLIDGRGVFPSVSVDGAAITSTTISNWNTAYGWGNHSGLYIPINPDADGPAWAYSDENPTINDIYIGGVQKFGADGDFTTGGALQARMLNAFDGSVNSTYGYYVGSLNFGLDSGAYNTTQVINSDGTFVGPSVSTGAATIGRVLINYDGTDTWFRMQSGNRMRITTTGGTDFIIPNTGEMSYNGHRVWTAGNDGSGSGLDADTVDGYQASAFLYNQVSQLSGTDLNNLTTQGVYHSGDQYGTNPNIPYENYFTMINLTNDSDRQAQLWFGDTPGTMYWRPRQGTSTWHPWEKVITTNNIGSQSVSYATSAGNADTVDGKHANNAAGGIPTLESNGYWYAPSWINVNTTGLFSGTNNAHLRPNTSSYGAWEMIGSKNGWSGIYFNDSGNTLMANANDSGFYNVNAGWQIEWYNGTLYVSKQANGGGTLATVLDSSNYTSYAATSTQGSQGATAYSWGNHADAGYFKLEGTEPITIQAETVTFTGNVTVEGTFTETSSIRFKENIVDLEPATEKVEQLRPVRYNKIGSEVEEIGLIAEEVAEIYPEVVTYNDEGQPDGINYTRLSVVLLKTVQELSERINKLESK